MAYKIPLYIPNISSEKLISIMSSNLNIDRLLVDFERLEEGTKFRAPSIAMIINSDAENLLIGVIQCVMEAARALGATQFSIKHEGFDMRPRPTNLRAQQVEHLMIASGPFKIDQINIFWSCGINNMWMLQILERIIYTNAFKQAM